jgi:hypothetical protein
MPKSELAFQYLASALPKPVGQKQPPYSLFPIANLNHGQSSVMLKLCLTWSKLLHFTGPDRMQNNSLWPHHKSTILPMFLCDSDIEVEVSVSIIKGLAR